MRKLKHVVWGLMLAVVVCSFSSCLKKDLPPKPPITISHLSLVVVHDPLNWTQENGRLLTDEAFRTYLDGQNHDIRLVYRGQPGKDLTKYFSYLDDLEKNGKPAALPYLLVGKAGEVVYGGAYPPDSEAAVKLVRELETVKKAPGAVAGGEKEVLWAAGAWRKLGGLKPAQPNLKTRWQGRVYTEDTPNEPLISRDKWVSVDFGRFIPEIADQDGQSSCCACAATQMAATLHKICGYKNEKWSIADLYRRGNNGSDDGMMLETALNLLTQEGICTTEYADMWNWQKPNYKKGYEADRAKHKLMKPFLCESLEQVGSAIQRCKPVVIGVFVTSKFEPDENGYIKRYAHKNGGGHALYLAGMQIKDGEVYYKVVNSWGKDWGKGGWAWIHESWIELGFGAWTAAVVSNDPDDPLVD
ncbi:MAG: C1 family peptidase [Proteobacteria bacterium]|nr:C1 family peptidase [Pseudomonadota bacterium]